MQQMSTFPGPQNTKELNHHFQDQDSSSTQSTSQSCPEAPNERETKIHGKNNISLRAGSVRSSGKSDDSQSVSSQEHGWTFDTYQTNFAVVPFPHPDPYYHDLVAAYGNPTLVQSQMLGTVAPRVPLPLDLKQDEPIFVNAKQYQAILRRRQYRARLEAQNKLSKGRKPYLHESRHRHALNRARGPGGRFVNMKKPGESKSPDLINGQDNQIPDELQLNTKMLERDVDQSGSHSTPFYSAITSGSKGDAIYHHQLFNYSAFSAHNVGVSQLFYVEKENLSLYGLPNERWEVNLPAEDSPPGLPEPVLGINFAREGMEQKEWLSFVAYHSDSWLLAIAFYAGARCGFGKADRKKLFDMINDLPSIHEVVIGVPKTQQKEKPTVANQSKNKSKPNATKRAAEPQDMFTKMQQKYEEDDDDDDDDDEAGEEDEDEWGIEMDVEEEEGETLCGICEGKYAKDEFWICCDHCETWFHGQCVKITAATAEYMKQYKCPPCSSKRARTHFTEY